jgi:hypothetical protein
MNYRSRFTSFITAAIAALLVVAGCSTNKTHSGADLSSLDEFKIVKNQTTQKELVEHFGEPGNTTTRGDGTRILTWTDARGDAKVNGTKFIPVVGLFTGPMVDQKITRRSLSATVREGIVVDFTESDGNNQLQY